MKNKLFIPLGIVTFIILSFCFFRTTIFLFDQLPKLPEAIGTLPKINFSIIILAGALSSVVLLPLAFVYPHKHVAIGFFFPAPILVVLLFSWGLEFLFVLSTLSLFDGLAWAFGQKLPALINRTEPKT